MRYKQTVIANAWCCSLCTTKNPEAEREWEGGMHRNSQQERMFSLAFGVFLSVLIVQMVSPRQCFAEEVSCRKGAEGDQGQPGVKGDQGAQGPQGVQGTQGVK